MDRGPSVKPSSHIEGDAIRIENILEDAGERVLLKPHLQAGRLIGPRVPPVCAGGRRGEVARAVPHGNAARFAQAILDLRPSDGSVTPPCYESLRDRLISAASVFDDLSRNELVEHLADGLRMM
jgi:hypothetical protein